MEKGAFVEWLRSQSSLVKLTNYLDMFIQTGENTNELPKNQEAYIKKTTTSPGSQELTQTAVVDDRIHTITNLTDICIVDGLSLLFTPNLDYRFVMDRRDEGSLGPSPSQLLPQTVEDVARRLADRISQFVLSHKSMRQLIIVFDKQSHVAIAKRATQYNRDKQHPTEDNPPSYLSEDALITGGTTYLDALYNRKHRTELVKAICENAGKRLMMGSAAYPNNALAVLRNHFVVLDFETTSGGQPMLLKYDKTKNEYDRVMTNDEWSTISAWTGEGDSAIIAYLHQVIDATRKTQQKPRRLNVEIVANDADTIILALATAHSAQEDGTGTAIDNIYYRQIGGNAKHRMYNITKIYRTLMVTLKKYYNPATLSIASPLEARCRIFTDLLMLVVMSGTDYVDNIPGYRLSKLMNAWFKITRTTVADDVRVAIVDYRNTIVTMSVPDMLRFISSSLWKGKSAEEIGEATRSELEKRVNAIGNGPMLKIFQNDMEYLLGVLDNDNDDVIERLDKWQEMLNKMLGIGAESDDDLDEDERIEQYKQLMLCWRAIRAVDTSTYSDFDELIAAVKERLSSGTTTTSHFERVVENYKHMNLVQEVMDNLRRLILDKATTATLDKDTMLMLIQRSGQEHFLGPIHKTQDKETVKLYASNARAVIDSYLNVIKKTQQFNLLGADRAKHFVETFVPRVWWNMIFVLLGHTPYFSSNNHYFTSNTLDWGYSSNGWNTETITHRAPTQDQISQKYQDVDSRRFSSSVRLSWRFNELRATDTTLLSPDPDVANARNNLTRAKWQLKGVNGNDLLRVVAQHLPNNIEVDRFTDTDGVEDLLLDMCFAINDLTRPIVENLLSALGGPDVLRYCSLQSISRFFHCVSRLKTTLSEQMIDKGTSVDNVFRFLFDSATVDDKVRETFGDEPSKLVQQYRLETKGGYVSIKGSLEAISDWLEIVTELLGFIYQDTVIYTAQDPNKTTTTPPTFRLGLYRTTMLRPYADTNAVKAISDTEVDALAETSLSPPSLSVEFDETDGQYYYTLSDIDSTTFANWWLSNHHNFARVRTWRPEHWVNWFVSYGRSSHVPAFKQWCLNRHKRIKIADITKVYPTNVNFLCAIETHDRTDTVIAAYEMGLMPPVWNSDILDSEDQPLSAIDIMFSSYYENYKWISYKLTPTRYRMASHAVVLHYLYVPSDGRSAMLYVPWSEDYGSEQQYHANVPDPDRIDPLNDPVTLWAHIQPLKVFDGLPIIEDVVYHICTIYSVEATRVGPSWKYKDHTQKTDSFLYAIEVSDMNKNHSPKDLVEIAEYIIHSSTRPFILTNDGTSVDNSSLKLRSDRPSEQDVIAKLTRSGSGVKDAIVPEKYLAQLSELLPATQITDDSAWRSIFRMWLPQAQVDKLTIYQTLEDHALAYLTTVQEIWEKWLKSPSLPLYKLYYYTWIVQELTFRTKATFGSSTTTSSSSSKRTSDSIRVIDNAFKYDLDKIYLLDADLDILTDFVFESFQRAHADVSTTTLHPLGRVSETKEMLAMLVESSQAMQMSTHNELVQMGVPYGDLPEEVDANEDDEAKAMQALVDGLMGTPDIDKRLMRKAISIVQSGEWKIAGPVDELDISPELLDRFVDSKDVEREHKAIQREIDYATTAKARAAAKRDLEEFERDLVIGGIMAGIFEDLGVGGGSSYLLDAKTYEAVYETLVDENKDHDEFGFNQDQQNKTTKQKQAKRTVEDIEKQYRRTVTNVLHSQMAQRKIPIKYHVGSSLQLLFEMQEKPKGKTLLASYYHMSRANMLNGQIVPVAYSMIQSVLYLLFPDVGTATQKYLMPIQNLDAIKKTFTRVQWEPIENKLSSSSGSVDVLAKVLARQWRCTIVLHNVELVNKAKHSMRYVKCDVYESESSGTVVPVCNILYYNFPSRSGIMRNKPNYHCQPLKKQ
jgi:hypothetical protein